MPKYQFDPKLVLSPSKLWYRMTKLQRTGDSIPEYQFGQKLLLLMSKLWHKRAGYWLSEYLHCVSMLCCQRGKKNQYSKPNITWIIKNYPNINCKTTLTTYLLTNAPPMPLSMNLTVCSLDRIIAENWMITNRSHID